MRVGMNPEKEDNILSVEQYHRVIIPVYIPNLDEDYFRDGLAILKLCLQSLLLTIHRKTKISIIDNGCCPEVKVYLYQFYNDFEPVDQLLNSKTNLGKVNAIFAGVKSNLEPLITIADADVMFLPGWQTEVEKLIDDFPEAGMVSPVPSSLGYRSPFINSTVYFGVTRANITFKTVIDPEGLKKFEESIGRKMYSKSHLEQYLTISNSKATAVIGCGHFVATFRAEVFENAPTEVCQHKIVGGSETSYLDLPNDKGGYLKLSTMGNYAYHLGNTIEPWMNEEMNKIMSKDRPEPFNRVVKRGEPLNQLQYKIGGVLRMLLFKRFKKYYFKFKGVKVPY